MNSEYKKVINDLKKKKWKDKEPWEKALEKLNQKENKQKRKIRENEISIDPNDFEFREF